EEMRYQNKKVQNVVVGRIVEVSQHPHADRLRVTKIDVGSAVLQVVTNVPVVGGEVVSVALDGAVLSDGTTIKAGELRGVLSEGMLCGLEEVGITVDDVAGQTAGDILRFDDNAILGSSALDALGYNDVILDVGVTANRPDCNSIYKLAKEVAVALDTTCREPEIHYETAGGSIYDMVSVSVLNNELCPRYMAGGVKNVKIFPSSQKIKSRLRAVGIRPINNIVDITNYVLIEIGQPMHSFDRREIEGNRIIVRNAEDGEIIVSLDGKENRLDNSMLVICDSVKPVAIAGVMGGLNSGIKPDTNEVVFEAAKFARDNIRRTSRALGLRSDSSARFEKGIDFASQEYALKRALTLVYESGSGDIVDGIIDAKIDYAKEREITFTVQKLRDILGCAVPKDKLISILARLGISVREDGKSLVATVREDREDIVGVNDIAEEFIRVYGYRHIKPTLFKYATLTSGGVPDKLKVVDLIKDTLSACGLHESVTYSFTSPDFANKLHLPDDDKARNTIRLLNPLGEALSVMRTTLSHSMLETLVYNATHFNKEAALFEVARVYLPKSLPLEDLPVEEERLSIGAYGDNVDFYTIKSALEEVFSALRLKAEYKRSARPYLHSGRGADVVIDGKTVGFLGEIHPQVAREYGIDNIRVYLAEISVDEIFSEKNLEKPKYKAFSKFPTIERDLAVVVGDDVEAGSIIAAIENAKIKHLTDVKIFDTYKSAQIGENKKSVGISFSFSSLDRTLTDDEIAEQMSRILAALKRKTGAKIR
ncbi:MAG: phenylalanine--tRNA ligase subunit beta, partial [[Eubacterium] siraeum]|nr:phenylalanine--tRNA ligase subunit beta [[Eubacterium] siraeum]